MRAILRRTRGDLMARAWRILSIGPVLLRPGLAQRRRSRRAGRAHRHGVQHLAALMRDAGRVVSKDTPRRRRSAGRSARSTGALMYIFQHWRKLGPVTAIR